MVVVLRSELGHLRLEAPCVWPSTAGAWPSAGGLEPLDSGGTGASCTPCSCTQLFGTVFLDTLKPHTQLLQVLALMQGLVEFMASSHGTFIETLMSSEDIGAALAIQGAPATFVDTFTVRARCCEPELSRTYRHCHRCAGRPKSLSSTPARGAPLALANPSLSQPPAAGCPADKRACCLQSVLTVMGGGTAPGARVLTFGAQTRLQQHQVDTLMSHFADALATATPLSLIHI